MKSLSAKIMGGFTNLKTLWLGRSLLRSFEADADDPDGTQARVLQQILKANKNTDFGRNHDFDAISDTLEFSQRIPIHNYEELRPYIQLQIDSGQFSIAPERPLMFAQTSGTTGKAKYIPILEKTLASYQRAQRIFAYQQYRTIPGIFSGKLLAIVSPAIEGHLSDGSPYGSMSGMVYQTMPENILSKYVLPPEIFSISDYRAKYVLISAFALREQSISCIATANPSTLVKLADIFAHLGPSLIEFIATGDIEILDIDLPESLRRSLLPLCAPDTNRAKALSCIMENRGGLLFSDIWPDLSAVVTWTSGNCALLLPKLKKQLSTTARIIEMGYLASEFRGTITIDCLRNLGVPTIQDNYFEFSEVDRWDSGDRETLPLSALVPGTRYYIIVTASHGLYRYFINDIIEVTGRFRNTPTIAFVQKGKGVTNLTGEKLYESQVIQATLNAASILRFEPDFFIMLADQHILSYSLYIESRDPFDVASFTELLNEQLGDLNIEYRAKAGSGRIRSADVKRLKAGTGEAHKAACVQAGQREGQFKMVKLQYRADIPFCFDDYVELSAS